MNHLRLNREHQNQQNQQNQNPTSLDDSFSMDVGEYDEFTFPGASPVPNNLITSLLIGQIKNTPVSDHNHRSSTIDHHGHRNINEAEMDKENVIVTNKKTVARKILVTDDGGTPNSKTFGGENFKRPNLPSESPSPACAKRIRSFAYGEALLAEGSRNVQPYTTSDDDGNSEGDESGMDLDKSYDATPTPAPKVFPRSQSESSVSDIMKAVEKIDSDPQLIGDASKRYVLPIIPKGKHIDLNEITGETLVGLIEGEYKDVVNSFEIIDCRYPYEFEGGHIRHAINLHTQKQIHEKYLLSKISRPVDSASKERHILVFHCEFSSQRAPDLCRFLREADRQCNRNTFPLLHYPELYVLHGGYKAFFSSHKEYCEPQEYVEMNHPSHSDGYRWHKSKSKTDLVSVKNSSAAQPPKNQRKTKNLKKFCL